MDRITRESRVNAFLTALLEVGLESALLEVNNPHIGLTGVSCNGWIV
jgi:hypothetical protein